jgi:hypothetical protein
LLAWRLVGGQTADGCGGRYPAVASIRLKSLRHDRNPQKTHGFAALAASCDRIGSARDTGAAFHIVNSLLPCEQAVLTSGMHKECFD